MKFHVVGVDTGRNIVALDFDAATAAIALDTARKQGLTVLSLRSRAMSLPRLRSEPAFPLTLFSVELMSLLDAGLNLVEALQTLSEKEIHGERQAVLASVLGAIYRGESFSQAVSRFPRHFPPLYVATVRASERTGNIREALARYIAYQEEIDRVRKKVVSASIYPAILIIVGSLVLAFLMFYVVPRFARVYEGVSTELPFFSQLLLSAGRGVQDHGWLIALFIAAAVAFGAYGLSRPVFRAWFNERLWRIPAIGERMKVYQLARLYRTVGMLLRAGIPVVTALDMVRDLLDTHLRMQLAHARMLIGEGQSISAALTASGLATPVAARMIAVGERGGEMGDMMERIARFHDDEIARFVDWFTRAFEPVLMAVLGVAIGLVVVLMYMPIFELAGSIQ
ncbi:MAG TPA: type II secretion system F family protein [Burkholderiales bacterium]|nr:type II secretion system F family protein [Burkholderiales bacterium]